jgi:hypothetical protein
MKLQVQPLVALCDEKVDILISDLPPNGKVKISASMSLPWATDVIYESCAWFTADSTGNIDLSKQKPDTGSYDFIDSMGLIVSMKSKDRDAFKKIAQDISVDKSQYINIVAECDQDRVCTKLERLFIAEGVRNQKISDEFVGELFYTENANNKTVVILGGSSGDLDACLPLASLLASRGFNVLALAYFKEKGLPPKLAEIPLEYFEKVFKWIDKNPLLNSKEI